MTQQPLCLVLATALCRRCMFKSSAMGQANAARDKLYDLRECDMRCAWNHAGCCTVVLQFCSYGKQLLSRAMPARRVHFK